MDDSGYGGWRLGFYDYGYCGSYYPSTPYDRGSQYQSLAGYGYTPPVPVAPEVTSYQDNDTDSINLSRSPSPVLDGSDSNSEATHTEVGGIN